MISHDAWTKKRILLALHACVAVILGVLIWIYPPTVGRTVWVLAPWLAYAAGTAGLVLVPVRTFAERRFDIMFLTSEGLLVGAMAAGYFRSEAWLFYPLLLLTVLLAALARRLPWALAMAAAVAISHGILTLGGEADDWGVLILQTALLLVTAGVVGYLAEEVGREEVSAELVDNALEISTILAGALEADEVYERATELLARLFRAGRVAVILVPPGGTTGQVAAGIDGGERVREVEIDLERYPEIRTALERRGPVVIGRAGYHPDMADVRSALPDRVREASILVTPIFQDDEPRGVVFVRLEGGGRLFTDHEIRLCRFMADAAGRALHRAEEFAEVAEAARRDGLTGLYNVRIFHRRLGEEVERADRSGASLSLLMIDLDYLKRVNDTYGHLAGDAVIRQIGMILGSHIRSIDTVARYGGEEFALLLPETGAERAFVVADRLRARVERTDFAVSPDPVTISIGVATYPDDATTPTDLLHKADQALYASKDRGRNRTTPYARAGPREMVGSRPGSAGSEDALTATLREALAGLETGPDPSHRADVVTSLASVMQARDPAAFEELRTVATLCDLLLAHLPLSERQRQTVRAACLLRDVGKMGIPDDLLQKRDFLTRDEYRRVREHPETGARIMAPLTGFEGVVPLIRHHHERWDGKGYPNGLKGEEIPYGARIVGLIDAFHAMLHRRPYADRLRGLRYATEEVRRNAGTQFDPELAERLLSVVENNGDILATLIPPPEGDPLAPEGMPATRDAPPGPLMPDLGASTGTA